MLPILKSIFLQDDIYLQKIKDVLEKNNSGFAADRKNLTKDWQNINRDFVVAFKKSKI